jgi:hypothetical protein
MRKLDENSRCLQMKQISSMEISPRALGHPWSFTHSKFIPSLPNSCSPNWSTLNCFHMAAMISSGVARGLHQLVSDISWAAWTAKNHSGWLSDTRCENHHS